MRLFQNFSWKTVIVIFTFFGLLFANKIGKIVNDESPCLCSFDGFGYYMYLPYFFENQDLSISKDWAQNLQDKYCDSNFVYQLAPSKKGDSINIYHMGMSFVFLPSYIIGDLSAKVFGYDQDGFSKPYHIMYLLNALLFIFLGLLYLRKLLLLFFKDRIVGLTILSLYLASNIFITFHLQFDLQHLYLFALNAILLYHLINYTKTRIRKHFWISVIILGLTVFIRPTQAILGFIPLILFIKEFGISKTFWRHIMWFPIIGLLWNIPQILYWSIVGGEPFIFNLHGEELILVDPNLKEFLFSYKKGWLLYSPLFLSILIGFYFLFRKERNLFWATFICTILYIYVMSSWECWWYASSYGSRVMVDIYPLLAIILGFFMAALSKTWTKIVGAAFLIGCILLNYVQSMQVSKYILHEERMTKQHYWYIFGKLSMDDFSAQHLELDRKSQDTTWIQKARQLPKKDYTFHENQIYTLQNPLKSKPYTDLTIGRLNLLELIPTDETMLEVAIVVRTSDSTKNAHLRMELVSPFNVYGWNNFEVSKGQNQDQFVRHVFKFNLVNIRHKNDEMQMYLDIWEDVVVEIKEMKITSYSLVRK